MRGKIICIILILLNITFASAFIALIFNNAGIKDNNAKLKSKLSSLEEEIKILEDKKSNKEECMFTKTLRVVDVLDYEGAVPEDKFVLVDFFQSFNPFVLRLNINDNVKEGLYYEFTFKGNKDMYTNNDASLNNFKILSIKETDKEGLSQIQEACR
jgi:hypothetical protein